MGDLDSLLLDLYSGVRDPHRLRHFIASLNDATGCHTAALTKRDSTSRSGNAVEAVGSAVDAENILRYESEFVGASDNLWFHRAIGAMKTGAYIIGDDLATADEVRRTRYHADFLRHIDTQHSLAFCGLMQGPKVSILTLCRSSKNGEFDSEQREIAKRIAPHWENAYALLSRMEELEGSDRAGIPALVSLDAQGRWLSGNGPAVRTLESGAWLGGPGRAIQPKHPASLAAWQSAFRGLGKGESTSAWPVPIYHPKGQLLAFASLRAYGRLTSGESLPHYVMTVRTLQHSPNPELQSALRAVFALTPAEATLASLLHETGELSTAAVIAGITLGSARTRLQTVFQKTGVHRQAELVAMLSTLSASIE